MRGITKDLLMLLKMNSTEPFKKSAQKRRKNWKRRNRAEVGAGQPDLAARKWSSGQCQIMTKTVFHRH